MKRALALLLAATISSQIVACDSAASRKAKEEAAIAAGTPVDVHAAPDPDSPAARAAAAEAAATSPDPGTLETLRPPPSIPPDLTAQARSEIGEIANSLECDARLSSEQCALFKTSTARDMHDMLDDKEQYCALLRTNITDAQAKLAAGSTDLEADLGTLAEEIEEGKAQFERNCIG